MKPGDKVKLSSVAVIGGVAAVGVPEDAQAANGDFTDLCGTTITSNTTVSNFNDTLTSTCSIAFSNDANLWVEDGNINADGYSLNVISYGASDITFHDVSITNLWDLRLNTEGSCDVYGNCTGNITFKGSKNNDADLEVEDTLSIDANGDILLKWASLSATGYGYGGFDDQFNLSISSDDASASIQGVDIGDSSTCANSMSVEVSSSLLIKDSRLYLCDNNNDVDISVNGVYGELNVKGNDIHMTGSNSMDVVVSAFGSANFSDNDFFVNSADNSLSVDAYMGSVIYKKNDFDDMSVDTGQEMSCQDLRNVDVGGDSPGDQDPCN